MVGRYPQMLAVAVGLVAFPAVPAAEAPADHVKALEGSWTGAWGGGQRDGTVFQPVIAELFIHGDQIELKGMPTLGQFAGAFECDAVAKRLRITPTAVAGQPPPKTIEIPRQPRQ